ncbi:MAG: GatB/YqeY domain-containing protein [Dehalococcoidia bacterium]|nr:GatB/YqeY domain-containing protein [Dehalococcoidia bacterium]
MALPEQLTAQLARELLDAMRQQDVVRRETLRLLQNALRYEEIAKARPLTDEEVNAVLQRQAKQRRDSITEFKKGNRPDLVQREEAELVIINKYLPQQMGRDEIMAIARTVAQEVGARTPGDKGRVMGKLMPQLKGKADGNLVNTVVMELLDALAKG